MDNVVQRYYGPDPGNAPPEAWAETMDPEEMQKVVEQLLLEHPSSSEGAEKGVEL